MSSYLPPPGTSDIFSDEIERWRFIQNSAESIFSSYGYGEIRTPIFEYSEVFKKNLGAETEVVQKEMYSFEDRGGRELTLRPEGTAGVMRALMKTDAPNGVDTRVFYFGPMFRGERPAAGRKRQFHQVGVECVGKVSPEYDAECITMLMHYIESLKINDARLLVNTRGSKEDMPAAEKLLRTYFEPYIQSMCNDCKERFNKNIWRILDCKLDECQHVIKDAPDVKTAFSNETRSFFDRVVAVLDLNSIKYKIDNRLVRGLDYYQHTVFEVVHDGVGGQSALAGGGRYSILAPGSSKSLLGVGFAAGVERLIMAQDASGFTLSNKTSTPIFLVSLGKDSRESNIKLAYALRKKGISVFLELEEKSMKSQMRSADKLKVGKVFIKGDEELKKGTIIIKDMKTGEQREVVEESIASLDILKRFES